MNHADGEIFIVDDGQDGYGARLVLFHDGQSRRRQFVRADDKRLFKHDMFDRLINETAIFFQCAADYAVRDKPDELILLVDNGDRAQALSRHLKQRVFGGGSDFDNRIVVAAVHNVADSEQKFSAQCAAGMEQREIRCGKFFLFH